MKQKPLAQYVVRDISMALLLVMVIGMALFPAQCAHAATKYLQYGQCIPVGRNRYCAPAKNVCPTPKPCPTSAPCPAVDVNSVYWYAVSSLLLLCGSGLESLDLPAESYLARLSSLTLGSPVSEAKVGTCIIRDWTKTKIIVNTSTTSACSVSLSSYYKDLETGLLVIGLQTLPPNAGKIYIAQ